MVAHTVDASLILKASLFVLVALNVSVGTSLADGGILGGNFGEVPLRGLESGRWWEGRHDWRLESPRRGFSRTE